MTSETRYLYQFDLYLGKKESVEENLEPGSVLKINESLNNGHCMFFFVLFWVFFQKIFNSTSLIVKRYEERLYSIGTVQKSKKEGRRWVMTERGKEMISGTCIPIKWLAASGWTGLQ